MAKKETMGMVGMTALAGAVVAVSAGTLYFFGSKSAEKRREAFLDWSEKMKKDVILKLKKIKKVDKKVYEKVISEVRGKYEKIKSVDPKELSGLVDGLKKHWTAISKEIKTGSEDVKETVERIKKTVTEK